LTWRDELHVLLDVDGETVEDGVEDTADLAGGDEVDVELVEDLGVLAERVGEASSPTRRRPSRRA
jgi:hypothetical protein